MELMEDQSRVIITVDKGLVMVVLDKQDYINKTQYLISQKDTYRSITVDPSIKHDKLINLLRTIKV